MTGPDELAAIADSIDARLGNENADRQTICEDVAARLRQLAAAAPAPGVLGQPSLYGGCAFCDDADAEDYVRCHCTRDCGKPGCDRSSEPYCTVCGEWAGMFLGLEGWHHFHGDPAAGGVRTLYDADHEAVIGWRQP